MKSEPSGGGWLRDEPSPQLVALVAFFPRNLAQSRICLVSTRHSSFGIPGKMSKATGRRE